jgi:hypothetical protein
VVHLKRLVSLNAKPPGGLKPPGDGKLTLRNVSGQEEGNRRKPPEGFMNVHSLKILSRAIFMHDELETLVHLVNELISKIQESPADLNQVLACLKRNLQKHKAGSRFL